MKKVIIVGSKGQDGQILEKRLKNQGVEVLSISREGGIDITRSREVYDTVNSFQPDEIYYLAAYHHSSEDLSSDDNSDLFQKSININTVGLVYFLEAIRLYAKKTKLFYAASALVFGEADEEIQDESTSMNPRCAYGVSKVSGISMCRHFRENYGVFASVGILYNHESEYRNEKFVSQKIIKGALAIKEGKEQNLELGDLSSEIDWGYAYDYVEAMIKILELKEPDDFIIATGKKHTVGEFVETVFNELNLNWQDYVVENKDILKRKRKTMVGNPAKLKNLTGWSPTVNFKQMIQKIMETKEVKANA